MVTPISGSNMIQKYDFPAQWWFIWALLQRFLETSTGSWWNYYPFDPLSELRLVVHHWSQVAWKLAEDYFQGIGYSLRIKAEAVATEKPTGIGNGKELKPKESKPTGSLEASESCLWGLPYCTYSWSSKKEKRISRDMNQTSWATLGTWTLLQSQNFFALSYPELIKAKYWKMAEKQSLIQIIIRKKQLTKSIIYMPSILLGID